MDKFVILIEGYAHKGSNGSYVASPSSTLVYSKGKKVLIDPGANPTLLVKRLKKIGLTTSDIDIVYLSHYHPDHFLGISLFHGKAIYDGTTIWKGDKEKSIKGKIPRTNIEIIKTPGHSPEHTSLLVETSELGKVCIAQDVFWWEDGKQKSDTTDDLLSLVDPFATDVKALRKSRKKVLELADWIIPGHGKMFRNPLRK